MVRQPRTQALGRRGASRVGCLFGLLLFAVALYYGFGLGGAYFRYWQLREEMQSVARLAPSLDDATIQRRLVTTADELGLPAHTFNIRRLSRPREIRISTSYSETVELPFTRYIIRFNPEARAPL